MRDNSFARFFAKRGSESPHSKLTDADVRHVRALIDERIKLRERASQLSNAAIAEKFGVHVRTIERISTGEGWSHVR